MQQEPPTTLPIPPLRSLGLPSLRGLSEALLPAAPVGGPNACAFSPCGYAVRFRLVSFAVAKIPIPKLTTHSATFCSEVMQRVAKLKGG
jgi:hypothetical protein